MGGWSAVSNENKGAVHLVLFLCHDVEIVEKWSCNS